MSILPREDECQRVWISFVQGSKGTELVLPLGYSFYRLGSTPIFEGDRVEVYWGDVIRAEIQEDGTLAFQDAIERAPLRHELYTLDQRTAESAELRALWAEIEACGGAAKQCMSGLFLVHLPEACLLDVGTRLRNIWQHEQDGDEE